jgi:hypothetical protein
MAERYTGSPNESTPVRMRAAFVAIVVIWSTSAAD